MHFGADYYPEYWPQDRWIEDARLMQAAGMNIVRVGEFAWRIFEPEEGVYRFELFDQAIELLGQHGIRTMMCTPTAAMPAWVQQSYPQVNATLPGGQRRSWGGRKNWCYSNPKMRELSRRVTGAMAAHYAGHPDVIAWQTDNEMSYSGCVCEHCIEGFRRWLEARYGSTEALNAAWGARFWSMEIHAFDEMLPPWERNPSPSHLLDWRRFQSDQVLAFNWGQVETIRAADAGARVTHNYMGLNSNIDYLKMAQDLDFVSNDMYPRRLSALEACSFAHDVIRHYHGGAGFWMNELQCGYINRENQLRTPAPGIIRLWTHQAIAHGADAIIYFRWRSCTGGCEQFHSGVVQHDGSPESRSYKEIVEIGREVNTLRSLGLAGSEPRNPVAILRSFDQARAMELYRRDKLFDYDEELQRYHRPLIRTGIGVDVAHPEQDLSSYSVVFAPLTMLITPAQIANLSRYVEQGGTLVTSFRLGAYDWNAVVPVETLPGDALARLFGIRIHEYECLMTDIDEEPVPVIRWEGQEYATCVWADMLEPAGAEVLGSYVNSWFSGYSAITRNRFGEGQAIYVGAALDEAFYATFVPAILAGVGIAPPLEIPHGVQVRVRHVNGNPIHFLMNCTRNPQRLTLPHAMHDVLRGGTIGPALELAPRDVIVLSAEAPAPAGKADRGHEGGRHGS